MSSAIANALAGLTANNQAINTVSTNLANMGTSGYKDQQVSFQELVNESAGGFSSTGGVSGSVIAQTSQQFNQGTLETTGNPYDAAIQGGGFFVVNTAANPQAGSQLYTRQGDFDVDANGHLLTAGGQFVQGWNVLNGTLNTSVGATTIVLPANPVSTPTPSSQFTISANLNANAAVNTTFSSPVQIYDSLGNPHTLTVTYTETSANNWTYAISMPSADVAGGTGTTTPLSDNGGGTLVFNGSGQLTTPAPPATIAVTIPALADGAVSPTTLNWNLQDASGNPTLTQYDQASANTATTQDGLGAGQLTSMSIGADGYIVAKYSNGTSENVAQIALASVLNPGSMQQVDNNCFAVTGQTAAPVIGTPSTGARGQITGGSLETSTVDIATEFTNLLQYERGYQANSKVITTEDQLVQTTIGLITA
jgi:flagellar hook protein FlgE